MRVAWLLSDNHDRPSAEELARRLEYSARLASVGKLASSAAHEMNQPLNVIRMAAFNLRRAVEKGTLETESALAKFDRIDTQISRAARLVGGMKSFSPTSKDTPTTIDPCQGIGTALELMAKRFTAADVHLESSFSEDEVVVNTSPSLFQEVVVHLVDNAIEAYGEAPHRDPLAADEEEPPRWIKVSGAVVDGKFVLTVEDAAGGLPPGLADRVLLPFVTSAEDGSHAGLGLSVCNSYAEAMAGDLALQGTELGTLVSLSLPLAEQPI